MKRWKYSVSAFLILVALVLFAWSVVIPSWRAYRIHQSLMSAETIYLQEIIPSSGDPVVLTSATLTASEKQILLRTVSPTIHIDTPGIILRSYKPYHRILLEASARDHSIFLSFPSAQIRPEGGPLMAIPTEWKPGLRDLFERFRIPFRSPSDYSVLLETRLTSGSSEPSPAVTPRAWSLSLPARAAPSGDGH